MKNLLIGVLLLLGLVSCSYKQTGVSTLSVQKAMSSELVISCFEEDVEYYFSNKRVSLKARSAEVDIKIIKKRVDAFQSWLGVTDDGRYYVLTSYLTVSTDGEFTTMVFTPVTKDLKLMNDLPSIVFTDMPICQ